MHFSNSRHTHIARGCQAAPTVYLSVSIIQGLLRPSLRLSQIILSFDASNNPRSVAGGRRPRKTNTSVADGPNGTPASVWFNYGFTEKTFKVGARVTTLLFILYVFAIFFFFQEWLTSQLIDRQKKLKEYNNTKQQQSKE